MIVSFGLSCAAMAATWFNAGKRTCPHELQRSADQPTQVDPVLVEGEVGDDIPFGAIGLWLLLRKMNVSWPAPPVRVS